MVMVKAMGRTRSWEQGSYCWGPSGNREGQHCSCFLLANSTPQALFFPAVLSPWDGQLRSYPPAGPAFYPSVHLPSLSTPPHGSGPKTQQLPAAPALGLQPGTTPYAARSLVPHPGQAPRTSGALLFCGSVGGRCAGGHSNGNSSSQLVSANRTLTLLYRLSLPHSKSLGWAQLLPSFYRRRN